MRDARGARQPHPREAPRAGTVRVGAKLVLPATVGGRGRLPRRAPDPRGPRLLPRRDQGRAPRRAGRAPALRRLPLHPPGSGRADPRNQRDDGPADRVRHRPGGLGTDRRGPRPHHVGDRYPPGRPDPDRLLLQPLQARGARSSAASAWRDDVPRPAWGQTRPCSGARDPARRVLRDALCAPLRRDRPARRHRPEPGLDSLRRARPASPPRSA
jgi:hypothetical protein